MTFRKTILAIFIIFDTLKEWGLALSGHEVTAYMPPEEHRELKAMQTNHGEQIPHPVSTPPPSDSRASSNSIPIKCGPQSSAPLFQKDPVSYYNTLSPGEQIEHANRYTKYIRTHGLDSAPSDFISLMVALKMRLYRRHRG